jgi:lipopolysaccharide assembly protein A
MNPRSPEDLSPGPYPGERQTRLSAVWTALAVAIVALAAVLVFILQNGRSVELSFLVFHGRLPLAIALLFAMMLGAVIVLASGAARILQLRGVARRARRARADASPPETASPRP